MTDPTPGPSASTSTAPTPAPAPAPAALPAPKSRTPSKRYLAQQAERARLSAIRTKERELKDSKKAEEDRVRDAARERRVKKEESERLAVMAERMGKRRLERKRRRLGIGNVKVAHGK